MNAALKWYQNVKNAIAKREKTEIIGKKEMSINLKILVIIFLLLFILIAKPVFKRLLLFVWLLYHKGTK